MKKICFSVGLYFIGSWKAGWEQFFWGRRFKSEERYIFFIKNNFLLVHDITF